MIICYLPPIKGIRKLHWLWLINHGLQRKTLFKKQIYTMGIWVVATQTFFMFTPKVGEDSEPILTIISFKTNYMIRNNEHHQPQTRGKETPYFSETIKRGLPATFVGNGKIMFFPQVVFVVCSDVPTSNRETLVVILGKMRHLVDTQLSKI